MLRASDIFQTDWELASSNEDDDFHTDAVFLRVSVREIGRVAGIAHEKALLSYRGYRGDFYFSRSRTKRICQHLIDRLASMPSWGDRLVAEIARRSAELSAVYDRPLGAGSNLDGLLQTYKRQLRVHQSLYQVCWIPEILQANDFGLTKKLEEYLARKLGSNREVQYAFLALTTDGSDEGFFRCERSLLDMARLAARSPALVRLFELPVRYLRLELPFWLREKLHAVAEEFGYLAYHGYGDRRLDTDSEYLIRLQDLVRDAAKRELIAAAGRNRSKLLGDKMNLIRTLRIENPYRHLFELEARFATLKFKRRLAQLKNFYFLDKMLTAFADRMEVPESVVRFMLPEEVLRHIMFPARVPSSVSRRRNAMVYYVDNESEAVWTSAKWLDFAARLGHSAASQTVKILHGRSASPGFVQARAVVVTRPADAISGRFSTGEIIVAREGDTDLIELLKAAGGLITDQGGVTCHLASIARDYGIPAVTGTETATQWIRTGDMVSLDADEGTVRKVSFRTRPEPQKRKV